jgi:hypothetical protein
LVALACVMTRCGSRCSPPPSLYKYCPLHPRGLPPLIGTSNLVNLHRQGLLKGCKYPLPVLCGGRLSCPPSYTSMPKFCGLFISSLWGVQINNLNFFGNIFPCELLLDD